MMQHVTEENHVERSIGHWEVLAIVPHVVDPGICCVPDVETHHFGMQEASQMVCDESVAAANIQYANAWWQLGRDLEGHVVRATDLLASPLSPPTTS
jgi:hypothetical protein